MLPSSDTSEEWSLVLLGVRIRMFRKFLSSLKFPVRKPPVRCDFFVRSLETINTGLLIVIVMIRYSSKMTLKSSQTKGPVCKSMGSTMQKYFGKYLRCNSRVAQLLLLLSVWDRLYELCKAPDFLQDYNLLKKARVVGKRIFWFSNCVSLSQCLALRYIILNRMNPKMNISNNWTLWWTEEWGLRTGLYPMWDYLLTLCALISVRTAVQPS